MAILTISREVGSGGREIGQVIVESCGYSLVDKEAIFTDLRAFGETWEQSGKDFDEHRPAIWERYDWSFRGVQALIQSILLDYAVRDKVVIVGRGANFLLNDIPFALKIRVVAPMDKRIETIMRRESVDRETAWWLARKADRESSGFIKALYGRNISDPTAYDYIFDTGPESLDRIASLVKMALTSRENYNTAPLRSALWMRAMAARIKARLVTNPDLCFAPTLDATADKGNIVIRGVVKNPGEYKLLEEAAKKLAGDLPLVLELRYRLR